ncbi:MAG: lactonase family protein [Oscillospiraceae bacterium]
MLLFAGCYTQEGGEGIYSLGFNPRCKKFTLISLAQNTVNPSYFNLHEECLYAVNELPQGGGLDAYHVSARGVLQKLNHVNTAGSALCHLSVAKNGGLLFAANYLSGDVEAYGLLPNGKIGEQLSKYRHSGSGPVAQRQAAPHAHSLTPDGMDRFAIAADLGTDQLLVYKIMGPGRGMAPCPEQTVVLPPGEGPRHVVFSANNKNVYLCTELGNHVIALAYNGHTGGLQIKQRLPLFEAASGQENFAADIHLSPDGRFLYVSVRGSNRLVCFSVDTEGALLRVGDASAGGLWPRSFAISPCGDWIFVANEHSGNVAAIPRNRQSGLPEAVVATFPIPKVSCVKISSKMEAGAE